MVLPGSAVPVMAGVALLIVHQNIYFQELQREAPAMFHIDLVGHKTLPLDLLSDVLQTALQ